jgi:hypothetical protein
VSAQYNYNVACAKGQVCFTCNIVSRVCKWLKTYIYFNRKRLLQIHGALNSYDNGWLIFHFADIHIRLVQEFTVEGYSITKALVFYNSFRFSFALFFSLFFPLQILLSQQRTVVYNFLVHILRRFTLAPPRNTRKTCHTTTKPLTGKSTYQENTPCVIHIMQILCKCCRSSIYV